MITTNFEMLELFEHRIAEFTGAPYAVAVDSCTNALFLTFKYIIENMRNNWHTFKFESMTVDVPRQTYVSVPMSIIHAGYLPRIVETEWIGKYKLSPYPVWDCACYFKENMYDPGTFMCLSFGWQKPLAIGKGGMILTDNETAWKWLRRASYDGRERRPISVDNIEQIGWHMNMDPEMAARGLMLFNGGKYIINHRGRYTDYEDLFQFKALRGFAYAK